ncbi:MAG: hypothetical protein U0625_06295 [Phycisphaerales bacterium]
MLRTNRTRHAWMVLPALLLAAVAAVAPARADDLVAPPMGLARLRTLLEATLEPDPSAAEMAIVVALHRDMVRAYEISRTGPGSELWKRANALYNDLQNLRTDPDRRRIRQAINDQRQLLEQAAAADHAMFEAIAAALAADEPDEAHAQAVRDGVARAGAVRDIDRLLGSMPMQEPAGIVGNMRDAVARLRVEPGVRTQLDQILADRDAAQTVALAAAMQAYRDFAVAAAGAFEQVFGGVLPPIGAVFSKDEAQRLVDRMRELVKTEGERFIAARDKVRAVEDGVIARVAALLDEDQATELRLRLMRDFLLQRILVFEEGNIREALRVLPADDPLRAQVAAFAAKWHALLRDSFDAELRRSRADEDSSFWDPTSSARFFRGMLGESPMYERTRAPYAEIDRAIAARVMAAGGSLGNLRSTGDERSPRLVYGPRASAWTQELRGYERPDDNGRPQRELMGLRMIDWTETRAPRRWGLVEPMDAAWLEAQLGAEASAAGALAGCIAAQRATYERAWREEVDARAEKIAAMGDRLRARSPVSVPQEARPALAAAVAEAVALRDTAWRAAETLDEAFFEGLLACAQPAEPLRQRITLARLRRFLERERPTVAAPLDGLDPHPDWEAAIRRGALSPQADARVREALVRAMPEYVPATIALRVALFRAASMDDRALLEGYADPAYRSARADSNDALERARRQAFSAQADLVERLLAAAGDERAALEEPLVAALTMGVCERAPQRRMVALAERACRDDAERAAVAAAVGTYAARRDELHRRAMRVALAATEYGRRRMLGTPARSYDAKGRPDREEQRRDTEAVARERADLDESLEIELAGILGRDRWALIEPPDDFRLHGLAP